MMRRVRRIHPAPARLGRSCVEHAAETPPPSFLYVGELIAYAMSRVGREKLEAPESAALSRD